MIHSAQPPKHLSNIEGFIKSVVEKEVDLLVQAVADSATPFLTLFEKEIETIDGVETALQQEEHTLGKIARLIPHNGRSCN